MILKDIGAERPRRIPKKSLRFPDAGFVVADHAVSHAINLFTGVTEIRIHPRAAWAPLGVEEGEGTY